MLYNNINCFVCWKYIRKITPPILNDNQSVTSAYDNFHRLREQQGESVASCEALYSAYKQCETFINSIDSTSSHFAFCKKMLLNLYPYLEDAVYFYAGRNNQSQTVRFAQAYVDLSLIYAFSNENITNRENYPLITIFVATKLFNQKNYRDAVSYYRA